MLPLGTSRVPLKNFSRFGLPVWPAIANLYAYIYERRAYYIDELCPQFNFLTPAIKKLNR